MDGQRDELGSGRKSQIINNGVTASGDGRTQVEVTDTRVENGQAKKWEAF